MKKKSIKYFILLFIFLFVGILYYCISVSSYQTSEDLNNFPYPKNAYLVFKNRNVYGYDWGKASAENGIPIFYKLVIKQNGWKKVEQEGGNTTYIKGSYKINLLSDRDYIEITKDL
ncbi:hypothetical protein [Cytobacillus praedii]|uniref:hypothetical protein n=1 Tax=Cytobacillus praedii TaxID=1742358 RepID=UPI002E237C6D|nr:hypothetical protein [Cytobacillus praedii]